MDIRKAKLKAREILEGSVYSSQVRNEILLSLKITPKHASPTTIKENRKLLELFEKKTCPAYMYDFQEWYRDRYGYWDTRFKYLISLEGRMYIRDAYSPAHKTAVDKEFEKPNWTGYKVLKDKGSVVNDTDLALIAEHRPDDLVLIIREQYE